FGAVPANAPAALSTLPAGGAGGVPAFRSVTDFARSLKPEDRTKARDQLEERQLRELADDKHNGEAERKASLDAGLKRDSFALAKEALGRRRADEFQTGRLGVDLAVESNILRNQNRLSPTAVRTVAGRTLLEIGGVWIDDGYQ